MSVSRLFSRMSSRMVLVAAIFSGIGMAAPVAHAISAEDIGKAVEACKSEGGNAVAGWVGGKNGHAVHTQRHSMRGKAEEFTKIGIIDAGRCMHLGKWHNYHYIQRKDLQGLHSWFYHPLSGTNQYFYHIDSEPPWQGVEFWARGGEFQWVDSWPNK